jgi:hypothetical protein
MINGGIIISPHESGFMSELRELMARHPGFAIAAVVLELKTTNKTIMQNLPHPALAADLMLGGAQVIFRGLLGHSQPIQGHRDRARARGAPQAMTSDDIIAFLGRAKAGGYVSPQLVFTAEDGQYNRGIIELSFVGTKGDRNYRHARQIDLLLAKSARFDILKAELDLIEKSLELRDPLGLVP